MDDFIRCREVLDIVVQFRGLQPGDEVQLSSDVEASRIPREFAHLYGVVVDPDEARPTRSPGAGDGALCMVQIDTRTWYVWNSISIAAWRRPE